MRVLLIVSLLLVSLSAAPDNLTENDRRVTNFLLQLSNRYDMAVPSFMYQRPLPRQEVILFLDAADTVESLTASEKEQIALLLDWYRGTTRLFGKEGDKGAVFINLDLMGDVDGSFKDSAALALKGIITPKLSGNIGGLSFYTDFSIMTEYRSDTLWSISSYEPYRGNPYNLFGRESSGNVRSTDKFRAGASWNAKFIRFDFAVDELVSGPARFNPLTFNASDMPVGYLRMTLDFDWMMYTQSTGLLRSMRDYSKFFHYHRLEVPLFQKRLKFGLNGVITYGSSADSNKTAQVHPDPLKHDYYSIDRSLNPVYLIPFLPYSFAEHYSGDRDNVLISFDISLRLPTSFYWYFEMIFDDISNPITIFSDDFGNKWGITVGGTWFGQLGEKNFNVSAEYTRIEPWVYTHFRGVSHRYTHYGQSLGGNLGPNSAQINGSLEYLFNQKNGLTLFYSNSRYNHTYRGGSIEHVFVDSQHASEDSTLVEDSSTKEFLSGKVQMDQRIGLTWAFLPFHRYEMETSIYYDTQQGVGLRLFGGFEF